MTKDIVERKEPKLNGKIHMQWIRVLLGIGCHSRHKCILDIMALYIGQCERNGTWTSHWYIGRIATQTMSVTTKTHIQL